MVGVGNDDGGGLVSAALREIGPPSRKFGRNLIVVGALDQDLGDVEGKQVAGISGFVAVGDGGGTATHQGEDLLLIVGEGEVSGEVDGEAEVNGSGEGDGGAKGDLGTRLVEVAVGVDVMAAGDPEGEVAAGGVAHGDDAGEIERVRFCERGGEVEAGRGVLEGGGIASAGAAYAAVFDGPGGDAVLFEVGAEMAGVGEVVLGLPPAAVEEDDQGKEGFARRWRQPEVSELRWAGAVGDAVVGGGRGAREDVHVERYSVERTLDLVGRKRRSERATVQFIVAE